VSGSLDEQKNVTDDDSEHFDSYHENQDGNDMKKVDEEKED